MVKVTLTGYVRCNHRRHPPGTSLEVAEEVAQHIVKAGAGRIVGEVEPKPLGTESVGTSADLSGMTVKKLRELAAERGLDRYSSMRKAELVKALGGE